LPIAEHGLIGDRHTVALVGTDGTMDWYCCPRFDSPSVFAAILDADDGGLFRISPDCDGWSSKQLHLPDTNILITRFVTPATRCPTHRKMASSNGDNGLLKRHELPVDRRLWTKHAAKSLLNR
jgi:GH15 family glucan-1,4-alpha-glucosidase